MKIRAFLIICFTALSVNAQRPQTGTSPTGPLPLDPLTRAERATAEQIARSNASVREFLAGDRSRLIYAEFISVKRNPEVAEPSRRFADVLFYRYKDDSGLRVLVDLGAGTVADIAPVAGRSVPLASAEVEEAARLALADSDVVRLLGERAGSFRVATGPATRAQLTENRIEALRTLGTTPDDPCTRDRCLVLFFRAQNRYIAMNQVVVDLTAGRVLVNHFGAAAR